MTAIDQNKLTSSRQTVMKILPSDRSQHRLLPQTPRHEPDGFSRGDRFKPDSYIQHRGTEHENESSLESLFDIAGVLQVAPRALLDFRDEKPQDFHE